MANEYKLPFTGEEIQEKLEKVDMLSEEKVDQTNFEQHTGNTTIHVTSAERTKWNRNITDTETLTEKVDGLPNNQTLIDNVVENVRIVKTAENPTFVTSTDDMSDSSKLYVCNGFIYQYGKTTELVEGDEVANFTNLKDQCAYKYGQRYSLSGGAFKSNPNSTSVIVPVPSGKTTVVIRFKGLEPNENYPEWYSGTSATTFTTNVSPSEQNSFGRMTPDSDGVYKGTCTKGASDTYIAFNVYGTLASDFTDFIITVDEPIEYTKETVEVVTEGFFNTGCAFAPADYEDRIIELENAVEDLESKIKTTDETPTIHNTVGTTFPPLQKSASTDFDGYDIDLQNTLSDGIYAYIDEVVSDKETVTKEILGKDESDAYDIVRYSFAKREYIAWQRVNYPKMYAWKNGSNVIYSASVSPRLDDVMYSTPYIGTVYSSVTSVNATNRSRTVNGLEFVRYKSGDIEPTVTYTDMDDGRNNESSITVSGITYNRYPLGDLGSNRKKLIPIFVYANEHGDMASTTIEYHETKMCALVVGRFLRDLASGKQANNPFYEYIRDNCMLIVIPVTNPFGFNIRTTGGNSLNSDNGYLNANRCNINRNYDTPGWDYMHTNEVVNDAWYGHYAGSQNETQYVMNTMNESGAVVAMSIHGVGGWEGYCAHQGQSPDGSDYNRDKLDKVGDFLNDNWGYTLRYYDLNSDGTPAVAVNTPDVTCKSPSYITQCGAYGGIVEIQADDVNTSGYVFEMKSNVIENAYAQVINLMAMWLSDYLESK